MPAHAHLDRLRSLKTLPQFIAGLRDELDWLAWAPPDFPA